MAGGSRKDLKARIRRAESIGQMAGAMELAAAARLRLARERAEAGRPCLEALRQIMEDAAAGEEAQSSPYVGERTGERTCLVVIGGDRGLAGGYNSGILRLAEAEMAGREAVVLPIGKKAAERFRDAPRFGRFCPVAESVTAGDCFALAEELCGGYLEGKFHRVVLCYTEFVSALCQVPTVLPLLPLSGRREVTGRRLTVYEPDGETVLRALVPEYLGGILAGALRQSLCSEQAARRVAMGAAADNAGEMAERLNLRYNRIRQNAITREITEVVAGAEQ